MAIDGETNVKNLRNESPRDVVTVYIPEYVAVLREHRKAQSAERLLIGPGWTDNDLVFCGVDGTWLNPDRFSRIFKDASRRLGLPNIRLHDLRHTWATLALSSKIHPKVVKDRLGQANISITLDTYSHVIAGLDDEAAETVAGLFRAGSKPVANGPTGVSDHGLD